MRAFYPVFRRWELAARWRYTALKTRTITIPKTKNKTTLVLPLVGEAFDLVQGLLADNPTSPYLFPSPNWNHYAGAFECAVKRANIPQFTYHCLRHTSASYMVQAGIPLNVVGAVL